jgi:hypothetical protein
MIRYRSAIDGYVAQETAVTSSSPVAARRFSDSMSSRRCSIRTPGIVTFPWVSA